MRIVTVLLLALLALVQAALWFGSGGWPQVGKLQAQLDAGQRHNAQQKQRNDRLQAEVDDLRQGLEMVEDRARGELGMVKSDEILVQFTARRQGGAAKMGEMLELARPLLAAAFTLQDSPVTWLEIAAFVLSLWMVACNMRVDPLGWPLAMASSLAYLLLFANSKLYGEAGLQLVFIGVSVWGWWQWLRARDATGHLLKVHRLDTRGRLVATGLTLVAWPLLGGLLAHATDSDVPYLDALATTGSIAGQVLLGRKLVENWPVWLAVNVFSVGLFAFKALWLTVLLYALFALLSVIGWRAWLARLERAHG